MTDKSKSKKDAVFYHAAYDEIWIKHKHQIERGAQGVITTQWQGKAISVPDRLSLFLWNIDPKKWKAHIKKKYLIRLGVL